MTPPQKYQCSLCKTSDVTPAQAEQTRNLYGKSVCPACITKAQAEAEVAAEAAMPPEYAILKVDGWNLDNGYAFKTIDNIGVSINLTRIKERAKAVEIAGKPWVFGEIEANNVVEKSLLALFDKLYPKTKPPNPNADKQEYHTNPDGTPVYPAPAKPAAQKPRQISAPAPAEQKGLATALNQIQDIVLSPENIIKLLCPDASFEEAILFLQTCKIRGLNPFCPGDVFLVKIDKTKPAVTIVGKYAFMKKADAHPDYRGYSAGIIVINQDGKIEEREGAFYLARGKNWHEGDAPGEALVGAWAKVHRNNRADIVCKVALQDVMQFKVDGSPRNLWAKDPAVMCVKVAVTRGHRDAFPNELGGWYSDDEIEVAAEEVKS